METGKNQYGVESQRKGESITNIYGTGEFENVKRMLSGQNLNDAEYANFKKAVKGVSVIIDDLDKITENHANKLDKEKQIIKLEMKVTISSIKGLGEKESRK